MNPETAHKLYFLNFNSGNLFMGNSHPNQLEQEKVEKFIKIMVYPERLYSRSATPTRDLHYISDWR
jgi:hypothetical protein